MSESDSANELLENLITGFWEGLLILNRQSICTEYVSQKAKELLECDPHQLSLAQILKTPEDKVKELNEWYEYLYTFPAPFEEIASLAPNYYPHSNPNMRIKLEFKPIRASNSELKYVAMLAQDVSADFEKQKRTESLSSSSNMIIQRYKYAPAFSRSIELIQESIRHLSNFTKMQISNEATRSLKLELHTLKGVLGMFSIKDISATIHQIESNLLNAERAGTLNGPFLVTQGEILKKAYDEFYNTHRETLNIDSDTNSGSRVIRLSTIDFFKKNLTFSNVDPTIKVVFHDLFCKIKLIDLLQPLKTLALNLAERLGKSIKVEFDCPENITVDPEMVESFIDHLTHAINNAVDHGIEDQESRERAGKPKEGKIIISAKIESSNLMVSIKDDGRGIDVDSIREKNKISASQPDTLVQNNIFAHGFSTKSTASEISGRGIGLDALKDWVTRHNGSIKVKSIPGTGCSFDFTVPLKAPSKLRSAI